MWHGYGLTFPGHQFLKRAWGGFAGRAHSPGLQVDGVYGRVVCEKFSLALHGG